MNIRFSTALIIDQDKDTSRAMGSLVKTLFNKVFTQTDIKLIPGDLADLKPQVVIINLSLSQRTENLELAEYIGQQPVVPLLFGYTESHEPELVAHALESGFQDLFMKPYDEAIIASKINKYFQHEKTLKHDLVYLPMKPPLNVKVNFKIIIKSVDENGITFSSNHYISKGTVIRLPGELSQELTSSAKTEFMVTKTWAGETWEEFFSYAEVRSPDDTKSSALRKFILQKEA
ncbi:MAG: hypothetical protein V4598_02355 [Bdellovibrionota bacterium]